MTLTEFENLTHGQIVVFKYGNKKMFGKIMQIYKTKYNPIIIQDIKNPNWKNTIIISKNIKTYNYTYKNLHFLTQEDKLELL